MIRSFGEFSATAKGCGTMGSDWKETQRMLNVVGATDNEGKQVVADGSWGARSQSALDKYSAHFNANKNAFAAFGIALTPCDALKFQAACKATGGSDPRCSKVPPFGGAAATTTPPAGAPPVAGPTSQFFEIQRWQQYLNTKGCKVNEQGLWDPATDAASKAVLAGQSCAPAAAPAAAPQTTATSSTSSRLGSRGALAALRPLQRPKATSPSTARVDLEGRHRDGRPRNGPKRSGPGSAT